ncbi:BPL-N domain-containing protein [Bdellovibrionota bacterium FG-1]
MLNRIFSVCTASWVALSLCACVGTTVTPATPLPSENTATTEDAQNSNTPINPIPTAFSTPTVTPTPSSTSTPTPTPTPPVGNTQRTYKTDVLLFAGSGTWSAEVASLASILTSHGATHQEVNSAQLNAMTVDEISQFGLVIFPGGAGGTEASSLSAATHAHLRTAVQQNGVSYFGICAGAFIADAPAPALGQDVSYGLGVVNGPILDYYYLENQGTSYSMTLETFADGTTADILWYGGPVTPNLTGGVIATYPDGNPAISQIWSGKGFVIISGVHPTATQSILSSLGLTSTDGVHLDLTWKLINAALQQIPLPAF